MTTGKEQRNIYQPKALKGTSRINKLRISTIRAVGALEKVAMEMVLSGNLYCNLLRGLVKMRQSLAERH